MFSIRSHHLTTLLHVAAAALAACVFACSSGDAETPSGCTPGAADACPAGQLCTAAGTCQSTDSVSGALVIGSENARACEILLESDGAKVVGAKYGAEVDGALRQREPRTSIAVSKSDDTPFAADAIVVEIDGATSDVSVRQVNCYGADGQAIDGATATLL